MNKLNKNKEESKEKYRSFKSFSKVSSIIYNLIATIILGIIVGYLIELKTGNNKWMLISILVFSLCGIISFYIRMVKFK